MLDRLRRWATGPPIELAIFRITVSVVVLASRDVWDAAKWSAPSAALPLGWGWTSVFPRTEPSGLVALGLTVTFTALTLIGVKTRVVSVAAALSLAWLLGLPQRAELVIHTHHLVWFLAFVACGPSGDALSVDAWRNRRSPAPSLAHGLPVRAAWLGIGLVFFFPGVWKLVNVTTWLDGLSALVEWKRFQLGLPRLELSSGWLTLGGVATIGFELAVGPALLFRRTRLLAVLAALAFHLGVWLVLGIRFSSLWTCYLVLLPWSRWLSLPENVEPVERQVPASVIVLLFILGGQLVAGVAKLENGWPFACYPTFSTPAPREARWLELEVDGRAVLTAESMRGGPNQRWWGLSERAAWDPSPARLDQLLSELGLHAPVKWTLVRVDLANGAERREALPTTAR